MIPHLIQEGSQGEYIVRVYDFTLGLETIAVVTVKIKPEYKDKVNVSVIKKMFEKK